MKMHAQNVRLDVDNIGRRETTPEIPQLGRPASPFRSGHDIHPPSPSAFADRANGMRNEDPLGPTANHSRRDSLQDDQRDPRSDSDEDFGSNKDPPPPNPDDDPPSSDSDEDPPRDRNLDDDNIPPPPDNENDPHITLENMKTDLQFIRMVEDATLESQFARAELEAFRNPGGSQSSPSDVLKIVSASIERTTPARDPCGPVTVPVTHTSRCDAIRMCQRPG